MNERQKQRFITRFARDYNLPAAAKAAGIRRTDAYELLSRHADLVDGQVAARLSGTVLSAIRAEYESIAFDRGGDARPGERIRALEQLRLLAAADKEEGSTPSLTVQYEYV